MQRKIFKNEENGNQKPVRTCDDDKSFIAAAKSILSDSGVHLAQLAEIKTIDDAMIQFTANGFHIEYEVSDADVDVYDRAIEKAPHLAKYIREMREEENRGGFISLSKIKIDKGSEWGEIYYYQGGKKNSKEVKFNGYEQITEEFLEKFRSMTGYIVAVLGFPEEWQDRITTTGVSICYKDDELMGMVITAQMEITGLNGPLNLNTPFIKFDSYCSSHDCTDAVVFNVQCENLLNEIFDHTKAYMKGDTRTKQLNLLAEGQ